MSTTSRARSFRTLSSRRAAHKIGLFRKTPANDLRRNRYIYVMLSPVVAYYLIFHYGRCTAAIIAFKDFSPLRASGSPWSVSRTSRISLAASTSSACCANHAGHQLLDIIFGFPAPIILALLLNEITSQRFKRMVQDDHYLPTSCRWWWWLASDRFPGSRRTDQQFACRRRIPATPFMQEPAGTDPVRRVGIWQAVGWGSIIYLAAIATVDRRSTAAVMDGASRWRQVWHITCPASCR